MSVVWEGPARAIALVVCAAIGALGVAGCGGDDQTTTPAPPAGKSPAGTQTTSGQAESTISPSTTAAPGNGGVSAPPENQSSGQPGAGKGSSGGGTAGSGPSDTPTHDVVPPPNTPQGKFEQYCNQNPGACG